MHRLTSSDPVPAGKIIGPLSESDGCVLLNVAPAPLLIIWPKGFSLSGAAIMSDGEPVAHIGDLVTLYGGTVEPDPLRRLLLTELPLQCQQWEYWLATGIEGG